MSTEYADVVDHRGVRHEARGRVGPGGDITVRVTPHDDLVAEAFRRNLMDARRRGGAVEPGSTLAVLQTMETMS